LIDRAGSVTPDPRPVRAAAGRPAAPARRRRLAARGAAAVLAAAACARTGFPEGGPADVTPPSLVSTIPEDRTIDVPVDVQIELLYDEPLSPAVQTQVGRLVLFNPDKPEVVTNAGGKKIEIQPVVPLEPRTTYSVTVLPGLEDRRSNRTAAPTTLFFSTGGPLTLTLLRGSVTAAGGPARGVNVRAQNVDRDFGYLALTDSAGTFELPSVAVGSYVITAWQESNGEEGFQYTLEAGDTTSAEIERVGAGQDVALELMLADTTAARLVRAEAEALDALRLSFSDSLDADQPFGPSLVELLRVPVEVAPRGTELDSIPQASIRGDSVAVDSLIHDRGAPRTVVALVPGLADSTTYAVRAPGIRNTAGLVTPEDVPWTLFRTRVLPDSAFADLRIQRTPPEADAGPGEDAGAVEQPGLDEEIPPDEEPLDEGDLPPEEVLPEDEIDEFEEEFEEEGEDLQ
jgi:hypothetical protein